MASRAITDCDPALQPLAMAFLKQCNESPLLTSVGAKVFIDCTYRSNDEQAIDYAKGRTTDGPKITDEPPGHSAHNCFTIIVGSGEVVPAARAFDFAIEMSDGTLDWNAADPLWKIAISIGQQLGLISGSCWKTLKDYPHMELANWRETIQPQPEQQNDTDDQGQ